LRRGGLVSDPLYTSSGRPLGVLRLKVASRPGGDVVGRSTNAKLEFFNQGMVEESGSSAIYNALFGGLQVGFTVSDRPLSAGSYTSFPPMFTARWGRASEYGSNAGGSTAIGRGFKSGGDAARGNAPFGSLV